MNLPRMLIGFAGLIVGFVGFMMVTKAWMLSTEPTFIEWLTLVAGAVMYLQSIPVMRASDQEQRRQEIRKLLKGEKD